MLVAIMQYPNIINIKKLIMKDAVDKCQKLPTKLPHISHDKEMKNLGK